MIYTYTYILYTPQGTDTYPTVPGKLGKSWTQTCPFLTAIGWLAICSREGSFSRWVRFPQLRLPLESDPGSLTLPGFFDKSSLRISVIFHNQPIPIPSMGRVWYIYLHENPQKSTIHGSVNIPFVPWMVWDIIHDWYNGSMDFCWFFNGKLVDIPWEPRKPSFLGVISPYWGFKTFICPWVVGVQG